MPCHEVRSRYDSWVQREGNKPMPLPASEPLVKAAKAKAGKKAIRDRQVKAVMISKKTIRLKISGEQEYNFMTRKYVQKTFELDFLIDDIHDMAMKFLPPLDPQRDFFQMLRLHHHPKNPKDLKDKALEPTPEEDASMYFKWRRVEETVTDQATGEIRTHVTFVKEWLKREEKPVPPKPKKKIITRKIEVSEEEIPAQKVPKERVLEEAIEEA
jgi:hypothetical protein